MSKIVCSVGPNGAQNAEGHLKAHGTILLRVTCAQKNLCEITFLEGELGLRLTLSWVSCDLPWLPLPPLQTRSLSSTAKPFQKPQCNSKDSTQEPPQIMARCDTAFVLKRSLFLNSLAQVTQLPLCALTLIFQLSLSSCLLTCIIGQWVFQGKPDVLILNASQTKPTFLFSFLSYWHIIWGCWIQEPDIETLKYVGGIEVYVRLR